MKKSEILQIIEYINTTGNIIAGYERNGTPCVLDYDLCDICEDGNSFFFQYNYINIVVEKENEIYKIIMVDGDFNRKEIVFDNIEIFKDIKLVI